MKGPSRREFLRRMAIGTSLAAGLPVAGVADRSGDRQDADRYDTLIKGGHLIDPAQSLSALRDVAITGGKISRIAADIPRALGRRVISASGHIVTPGLIDIHVHVYDGVVRFGIPADVVGVEPHSVSQIHRHNLAETVLFILGGAGTVLVGEHDLPVREGDRVLIPKGTYHGVRTGAEALRFLSVQSPPILNRARNTLDLEPLDGE